MLFKFFRGGILWVSYDRNIFFRKGILFSNLVPRALFPGFGGGAGKGPGIGRSHDHQTPSICGCNKLAFKLAYDRIR